MVSGYWIDDDFILVYYFPYKVSKNISPVMIHDFFLWENNYFREAETIDLRTSLLSVPTKWLEKLENYGRVWEIQIIIIINGSAIFILAEYI